MFDYAWGEHSPGPARAALIAASPRLLEALKRYRWALNEVASCDTCDTCRELARDVGPELDKAIAEAEVAGDG